MITVLKFIQNHPLNKGTGFGALSRYFRWQLATRTLNLPVIIHFVNDTRLVAERGVTVGPGNYYVGLLEYEVMAFTLHYLRPEDLFIDVGANIGAFTVLAGGVIGASCVSIEPIPQTYQRLLDNININRISDHVVTINAGLGDKIGKLRFTSAYDSVNHVMMEAEISENNVEVDITTLDCITKEHMPEMIKIDVEGFESKVVAGGECTLSRKDGPNAILMELRGHGSRYGFSEKEVHEKMLQYGYKPFVYDPKRRELDAWQCNEADKLGDMIYIRDDRKAKGRLKDAPAFHVLDQSL